MAAAPPPNPPLESTTSLLERIRAGDAGARERLFARTLPALRRWAHRRLPARARDLADTDDLVQTAMTRALANLDTFESRGEGAFLAYLRQILMNLIRNEIRRTAGRGVPEDLERGHPDPSPSPLQSAVAGEALERYEEALARLRPDQREAVILRVEFGYSHAEIAEALGKPSANAARMTVARALLALAETLRERP